MLCELTAASGIEPGVSPAVGVTTGDLSEQLSGLSLDPSSSASCMPSLAAASSRSVLRSAYLADPTVDASLFRTQVVDVLPSSWTVVCISAHSLLSASQQLTLCVILAKQTPLYVRIPVCRQRLRQSTFPTIDKGLAEFDNIMEASKTTTSRENKLETKQSKVDWWTSRAALDQRLCKCLADMELSWLGVFRCVFDQPLDFAGGLAVDLRKTKDKVEAVIRAAFPEHVHAFAQLDERLWTCIFGLGARLTLDDCADWILAHFLFNNKSLDASVLESVFVLFAISDGLDLILI